MNKSAKGDSLSSIAKVSIAACSILALSSIFYIGYNMEYPNRNSFDFFKALPVQNDMIFDDIHAINIQADNIDLTIVESGTDKVLIKNSIETTGVGVFTEPKIWVSENTLFYDQGLMMNVETWEIIEESFDFGIHTSGSLIIEVPRDLNIDFVVKNPNGHVNFDIYEANSVTITSSNSLDFYTKCATLKITADDQNTNIYSNITNLNANTKSGNINIFEPINNIKVSTKSGDVSVYVNDETKAIDFETKNGNLNIFPDEIGGYNHNDEYHSISSVHSHKVNINAREVNVHDKNTINEINSFLKED